MLYTNGKNCALTMPKNFSPLPPTLRNKLQNFGPVRRFRRAKNGISRPSLKRQRAFVAPRKMRSDPKRIARYHGVTKVNRFRIGVAGHELDVFEGVTSLIGKSVIPRRDFMIGEM